MKTRHGFVSNSSSASFIVSTKNMSLRDKEIILNYSKYVENQNEQVKYSDSWNIYEDVVNDLIEGYTIMDNGDFGEYLLVNGIGSVIIESDQ